jgi:hypothetical protein
MASIPLVDQQVSGLNSAYRRVGGGQGVLAFTKGAIEGMRAAREWKQAEREDERLEKLKQNQDQEVVTQDFDAARGAIETAKKNELAQLDTDLADLPAEERSAIKAEREAKYEPALAQLNESAGVKRQFFGDKEVGKDFNVEEAKAKAEDRINRGYGVKSSAFRDLMGEQVDEMKVGQARKVLASDKAIGALEAERNKYMADVKSSGGQVDPVQLMQFDIKRHGLLVDSGRVDEADKFRGESQAKHAATAMGMLGRGDLNGFKGIYNAFPNGIDIDAIAPTPGGAEDNPMFAVKLRGQQGVTKMSMRDIQAHLYDQIDPKLGLQMRVASMKDQTADDKINTAIRNLARAVDGGKGGGGSEKAPKAPDWFPSVEEVVKVVEKERAADVYVQLASLGQEHPEMFNSVSGRAALLGIAKRIGDGEKPVAGFGDDLTWRQQIPVVPGSKKMLNLSGRFGFPEGVDPAQAGVPETTRAEIEAEKVRQMAPGFFDPARFAETRGALEKRIEEAKANIAQADKILADPNMAGSHERVASLKQKAESEMVRDNRLMTLGTKYSPVGRQGKPAPAPAADAPTRSISETGRLTGLEKAERAGTITAKERIELDSLRKKQPFGSSLRGQHSADSTQMIP